MAQLGKSALLQILQIVVCDAPLSSSSDTANSAVKALGGDGGSTKGG
jgi:hypothetical protein